jgi:hypothetical protein
VRVREEELAAADVLEQQGYAAWLRELARLESGTCPPNQVEISLRPSNISGE